MFMLLFQGFDMVLMKTRRLRACAQYRTRIWLRGRCVYLDVQYKCALVPALQDQYSNMNEEIVVADEDMMRAGETQSASVTGLV